MAHYYYLVSSLPMLEFGMKMPFSYSYFLSLCQEQLSNKDMGIIKRVSILPSEEDFDTSPILREWKIFDTTLRNELVKFRAHMKSKDPYKYIRGEDYTDPFIAAFAHWLSNQDSPWDAELNFDKMRWNRLEDMSVGHYFDIEYLVIYGLKLQILEHWETIKSGNGMKILGALVER